MLELAGCGLGLILSGGIHIGRGVCDGASSGVRKMADACLSKQEARARSTATRSKELDGNKRMNRVASNKDNPARGGSL